jgi:aconitate hydratase 2/2-methylisocitrate dehydratase
MSEIKEPLLACRNDPDDVKPLSELQGAKVDEVFIGSRMINIGHFRTATKLLKSSGERIPTQVWIVPSTKIDVAQLFEAEIYNIHVSSRTRTEMSGYSLCMCNQALIEAGSTAVSSSTRSFPNHLGKGADVYHSPAALTLVAAILGKLQSIAEYTGKLDTMSPEIYKYLNFDRMPQYIDSSKRGQ